MGKIIHVVQIAFREDADASQVTQVLQGLGSLQQTCREPDTGRPYIASVHWGQDVSPEGAQNGFTHMFVFEFDTVHDRDAYLEDPDHVDVADALTPIKEKVQVLDIEV